MLAIFFHIVFILHVCQLFFVITKSIFLKHFASKYIRMFIVQSKAPKNNKKVKTKKSCPRDSGLHTYSIEILQVKFMFYRVFLSLGDLRTYIF